MLESLDGSVTTLEEQVASLEQALTVAENLASAAFGSSLAYTLASTVILGSSVVYTNTNASLRTLTLKGQFTYVNRQTILPLKTSYLSPNGQYATSIQYISIRMNNGTSNYGGYVSGGSVYSTGNSFLLLSTNVSEVNRELLRLMFDVTASLNFIGLNNMAPHH